jgi:hypothetical protein
MACIGFPAFVREQTLCTDRDVSLSLFIWSASCIFQLLPHEARYGGNRFTSWSDSTGKKKNDIRVSFAEFMMQTWCLGGRIDKLHLLFNTGLK